MPVDVRISGHFEAITNIGLDAGSGSGFVGYDCIMYYDQHGSVTCGVTDLNNQPLILAAGHSCI